MQMTTNEVQCSSCNMTRFLGKLAQREKQEIIRAPATTPPHHQYGPGVTPEQHFAVCSVMSPIIIG